MLSNAVAIFYSTLKKLMLNVAKNISCDLFAILYSMMKISINNQFPLEQMHPMEIKIHKQSKWVIISCTGR